MFFFQPSEHVDVSHFELGNESRWKPMSQDAVLSVCGLGASPSWPTLPPLCSSTLDPTLVSNDLEQQLRVLLFEHRRVCLTNAFVDLVCYLFLLIIFYQNVVLLHFSLLYLSLLLIF